MMSKEYQIGMDVGSGTSVGIIEKFMTATPAYPNGSYLREVAGVVEIATGHYATLHPDKPSPYWHGEAPFFVMDTSEWTWK